MPYKANIPNRFLNTWVMLHQVYRLLARVQDVAFHEVGITAQQHAVLAAINNLAGPVSPSEVAHWLYQNPNGISMLVKRMEKDGLVKRVKDSRDRRTVHLTLTNKGQEILERSTVVGMQVVTRIMSELSAEELGVLDGLLDKLRDVVIAQVNPGEEVSEIKMRPQADVDRFLGRRAGNSRNPK